MTNNPYLHYRPDLFIGKEVSVSLPAADWAIFMSWLQHTDLDGISFIAYQMSEQVAAQIYTPQSLKAANAEYEHREQEKAANHPVAQMFRAAGFRVGGDVPDPSDFVNPGQRTLFDATETWIIVCDVCGSRDEYPPEFTGPLTCEHNGPRHLAEVIQRPKGTDDE